MVNGMAMQGLELLLSLDSPREAGEGRDSEAEQHKSDLRSQNICVVLFIYKEIKWSNLTMVDGSPFPVSSGKLD